MSRQPGQRVIVIILLLLAVSATYLHAECTEKATFSFTPPDLTRTISSPGYTAVYRIHNDGPSSLKVILKRQASDTLTVTLKKGEAIDIAKPDDQRLVLDPMGAATAGSFQLIWAK